MIKGRNALKAEFVSGTAATEDKFKDVFDSHYNRYEDSVLMGPIGLTGKYGLQGPTGGTFNGLLGPAGSTFYNGLMGPNGATHYSGIWLSTRDVPVGPTADGLKGELVFGSTGATVDMYIHNGTQWFKFSGNTTF